MVVASIDLMDGKAVQLRQGKEKILEQDDPVALAKSFDRYGEVAVIDLDAAMGKGSNLPVIKQLLKVAECRVGGGIRNVEQARELLSLGATRVILGSKAFENDQINHAFLKDFAEQLSPQRIIIAIDALHEEITTRGWKHQTGLNLYDAARAVSPYASGFLFTCVEREGTMEGLDVSIAEKLIHCLPNHKITVAGGVSTLAEVGILSRLKVDIQLGMALYTGTIDLADAFIEGLNWKNDLLPTIVQDRSGQVLMLAYSNKDSLLQAFKTEKMTYYSRSRQQLWVKGETSGHYQKLLKLRADCDRDALLARVDQTEAACHTGDYSCFGDKHFSLQELYQVISERFANPTPGSYTAKLLNGNLLNQKILEEAQEVVEAEKPADIIWEAADVLYFLTALLAQKQIPYPEVLHELRRRRKK